MDQGWVLVILTSCITFLGCCVVYTDVIYKFLFPKRALVKPFNIVNDTNFLICSLALSSGCLIFTSLYKLLPKSFTYLKEIPQLKSNHHLLKLTEYSCYLIGIGICSLLNWVIHMLTNESLIHCAHSADEFDNPSNKAVSHSHGHSHTHTDIESQSHNTDKENFTHSHNFTDSNDNSHSQSDSSQHVVQEHKEDKGNLNPNSFPSTLSSSDSSSKCKRSETFQKHSNLIDKGKSSSDNSQMPNCHSHTIETQIDGLSSDMHLPKRSLSLMDLSLKKLKGETMTGRCFGDIDCCSNEILNRNHLHRHNTNELYFCTKPSEENLLFFPDKNHMITDRTELSSRYPDLDIHSPLIANDVTDTHKNHHQHILNNYSSINKLSSTKNNNNNNNSNNTQTFHHYHVENNNANESTPLTDIDQTISLHSDTSSHSHYHDDHSHSHFNEVGDDDDDSDKDRNDDEFDITHHHHIKTPLSRLLSIGLQTILAITLHKFPEGFIMYSTSKTNPELGMSIFLSMFIHNFVEGFTMTLPLYIALNSRAKAILISGTLGTLSQPLGACIGYFVFKDNKDMNDPFSIILVAVLLAITSGFLTYISLQMFASAIGFGGRQEKVLKWCFIGIFLICLSNILL
ncbi:hypothetical protein C6P40_002872 [Pichia californica]|uniref:Zinc-regulated transporter 3 n=1 Tax=Pichia californica TaxID=460514 RepID=A0A9P6WJB2_9ASCO|nr:hypothetical protein C6P42_002888 [[Candida] californica]KAG0687103.1 hypothetical protein C6P40_002872 [[Candida] californica]